MDFPHFAIGIPTLNRWDLLYPTVWMYLEDFPKTPIYILDNGNQACNIQRPNIHYIKGNENLGVAGSWNKLCETIYNSGIDYPLILNDDIYLGRSEYQIGNLLYYQKGNFFTTPKDWCAFIIPRKTYQTVGNFDEAFRAYYEDNDYEYRLKLSGKGLVRWEMLQPTIYRNNSTSSKLPEVLKWSMESKEYYVRKWGGLPGGEKFTTPFNEDKNK